MSRSISAQKRSQWRKRFQRFGRSKLTVAEFCRRERVSVPSFYQWRRKLADSSSSGRPPRSTERARFIPVQVAPAIGLQVEFPNGVRLSLPSSDQELVRMSIDAIAQAQTQQGGA